MKHIFELLKDYPVVLNLQAKETTSIHSIVEEALSIATTFNENKQQMIIVKDNLYHAEQLYEQLSHLIDDVYIFMSEESKRIESIASSPEFRANRLAILSMLAQKDVGIVVTHTAALLRYLPSIETFKENTIHFTVNEESDYKGLQARLIKAGYQQTKRVDQPLTFAIRGEIVDIFSINYDYPVRIEFFDREVESIRFFDIETQLTKTQLNHVSIIGASDILFSDEEVKHIVDKIKTELDKNTQHDKITELNYNTSHHIEYLEKHIPTSELYHYYAYLKKSTSLLDYVSDGLIMMSDYETIRANEQLLNAEVADYALELYDNGKLPLILSLWNSVEHLKAKHEIVEIKNIIGQSSDYAKIHEMDIPIQQFNYVIEEIIKQSEHSRVLLSISTAERKTVERALLEVNQSFSNEVSDTPGISFIKEGMLRGFTYMNTSVFTNYELFNTRINVTRFSSKFRKSQQLNTYSELEHGDYVVHNIYGVGRYIGIETREIQGYKRDFLKIMYRNDDSLHVPLHQFSLVRKFVSRDGVAPKLNKLGTDEWQKTKAKVSESVAELAGRLVEIYSNRSLANGFKYEMDEDLQKEFNQDVEFELTEDQVVATSEILSDMQSEHAMDRLLIGDVGFGKTEVSMRAAFLAVMNNKQVAFLAPTTILAAQHYESFKQRFRNVPINIGLLNRFVPPSKVKEVIHDVREGKIDIIIGTHRLLSKDIKYSDLGLLIIDEEQRFGVEHKEIIKEMKQNVEVLSLSATPIPRTLQMSLVGVRQMSTLRQAPKNRKPVQTYVIEKNVNTVNQVIMRELARGGQAFYLHNNVSNLPLIAAQIERDVKDSRVGIVNGQMAREDIEDIMIAFNNNEINVLVCTTIIETGIDIPNANTIIIDNADTFGLSQLYQIRGRVGRSDQVAYAYLMYSYHKNISEIAAKRLNTIKEFTELGSGYKIAMRDLTIRGAGEMLGPQQSGFIDTVGIDMYIEMLNEAVAEAQGKVIPKVIEEDRILINAPGHIPEKFTTFDDDKISLYQDIDRQTSFKELTVLYNEVTDIYGRLPKDVDLLFEKKRLEILLNHKVIHGYREINDTSEIIFTTRFSSEIDGIKLFSDISKINRDIKILYKNDRISIRIKRRLNWINDIMDILEKLNIER
ncbi:MAG: transcription-repair coupling factor [Erysipelothrix sp.]|nr:transcription-repair coupling factor [Erysipelothrix sp.]